MLSERPTEVTAAIVGLLGAVVLYMNDRDIAALVTAAMAALPAIVTAIVVWWRKRHAPSPA